MKKTLRWVVIGIVVLILAVYVVCDLFLGSIVTRGVNTLAPRFIQTSVVLEGAQISPLTGSGTLSGLTVGNPKGWSQGNIFSFAKVHVSVAPASLLGGTIVVNDVTIDDPQILYETHLVSSNVGDLLKTLENATGGGSHAAASESASGKPMKFEVKSFSLSGGTIRLGVGPTAVAVPLPPIHLENLGTAEGGITADQLAFAVMRSLSGTIVSATTRAAGQIGSTLGAAAGSGAKNAFDSVKGLFGGQK